MAQHTSSNYNALMVVQQELQQSLADALSTLNLYVESPNDTAALANSISHLRQIKGTLSLLNLSGASLLADEIFNTANAIKNNSCSDLEKAQEQLLHALMVLPHYLEILPSGIKDHPLCLIETINELKQAQDKAIIQLETLFKPALAVPLPAHISPAPLRQLPDLGIPKQKIAHAYQVSLLKWLRETNTTSLKNMRALIRYLRMSCNEERTTLFWWLSEALIEALLENGVTNTQPVKQQLGKLTPPIKTLTEHGEQQLLALFQNDQFIHLLLLIAQTTSKGKHVTAIKDLFDIHHFDHYNQIYSVSDDAKHEVSSALLEQIAEIKEQFNQYEYSDNFSQEDVSALIDGLTPIAATLGMLSAQDAKAKLDTQLQLLTELQASDQLPNEQQLETLADDILAIELQLSNPTESDSSTVIDDLQKTVINECLFELDNIKEHLSLQADNLASHNLPGIAEQLQGLAGSVDILNLPTVSELLTETVQMLQQPYDEPLSENQVDVLAEVISACELYLDGLVKHGHAIDSLITKALQQIELFNDVTSSDSVTILEEISAAEVDELDDVNSPSAFAEHIDVEIAETFLEEAEEVLSSLETQIPAWQGEPDAPVLLDIRRHYHTLKGSGRMAGADSVGELAWAIENLLNKVIETTIDSSEEIVKVTQDSFSELPVLIDAFKQGDVTLSLSAQQLIATAESLIRADHTEENEDILVVPEATEDASTTPEELDALALDTDDLIIESPEFGDDATSVTNDFEINESEELTSFDLEEAPKTTDIELDSFESALEDTISSIESDNFDELESTDQTSSDLISLIEEPSETVDDNKLTASQPTSVDRYIVAQAELENQQPEVIEIADKQPTSVDRYIAAQAELASQQPEVIEVTEKQPTSVDRYIEAQAELENQQPEVIEITEKQATSVDRYIAARAELENQQPEVIEVTEKQPTSVDRYIAAQAELESQILVIDDDLSFVKSESKLSINQPENVVLRVNRDDDDVDEDKQLETIFLSETKQHIAALNLGAEQLFVNDKVNNTLLRAIHSLKGCANIAQVTPIALIANEFDNSLQQLHKYNVPLTEHHLSLIKDTISGIESTLNSIENDDIEEPDLRPLNDNCYFLIKDLPSTPSSPQLVDPDVLLVFLEETDELLGSYTQKLRKLQRQPDSHDHREALHDILLKLSDNAQHAEQDSIAELYRQFDRIIQSQSVLDQSCFDLLETGYDYLNNDIESLLQNKAVSSEYKYTDQVDAFLAEKAKQEEAPTIEPITFNAPEVDYELLEAFIEENAELLESSGEAIKQWQAAPTSTEGSKQLQRDLHTLKGASRAIGLEPIGELTHQTESLVIAVSNNKFEANTAFFTLLHRCQDKLAEMQEQLANQQSLSFAHDLAHDIASFSGEDVKVSQPKPVQNVTPQADKQQTPVEPPAAPAPVEQIRVRADLLDYLTNFAGEVNISRDRVTQQNTAIHNQLKEMEDTVSRLQEQLRNLELETENQILFSFDDEKSTEKANFDPLELDRFSMIQQLSRGLTESVSDLTDISHSMDTLIRETENILLQQSRVSADLQQGLMNTRLLPFSAITPRLERIVRQTNAELGKESALKVEGATNEIDRTVLDKITAPIEHIIRNAIAHGLEHPEQRGQVGKPQVGLLTIIIERQGSEFVITIKDDGQGIDVNKVKQKAIERGLIDPNNIPSDEALISLILTSGFSTADNVSQVAGRGVGMDVVSNEIRALKGRLSIQSTAGKGTTFRIRLPLTLSIIQALLVSSANQNYALPLANLHSGERVSVAQIKTLLSNETPTYQFNGEQYDFIPLCHLLDTPLSLPENNKQQLPLLLLNTGTLRVALLVDEVNNAREIVIKSIGKQLNTIHPLNGATILGDGEVVFIIDIPNLVESYLATEDHYELLQSVDVQQQVPLAMVVDDSITIRKASTNFLKRQGFDVMTAKDGVDALSQLAEQKPDIILLDIEMPRMDGFEFAAAVRSEEGLKQIPIIMITSRTGEKHRERASDIGVDVYLGKPYHDEELISAMQSQLGNSYPDSKV